MAFDDITPVFRQALVSKRASKLGKQPAKARSLSSADMAAQKHGLPTLKMYMNEAYIVLKHINDMSKLLSAVKRPYLNVDSHAALTRSIVGRKLEFGASDAWASIKHLSDDERDQIDLQARVVFTQCADHVKRMEALEKQRAHAVSMRGSGVLRLLPTRLLPPDATSAESDFIASHNASITWFLTRRLAEASATQKEMQEERIRRQLERARTLGSGAAREAALLGLDGSVSATKLHRERLMASIPSSPSSSSSWARGSSAGSSLASSLASLAGSPLASSGETARPPLLPSALASTSTSTPHYSYDDDDDDLLGSTSDASIELSQSQIQQFESENAAILRGVQDTLASVQKAESSLLDIAQLQTELVQHLEQQTELTDRLYEDAIATSGTVDAGNKQLVEARRRQSDSRLFILVFLFGASFALLFLHYY